LDLTIREAIEDAGFDIADTTSLDPEPSSDRPAFTTPLHNAKRHLDQCHICQHDLKGAPASDTLEITEGTTPSGHSNQRPASLRKDHLPRDTAVNRTRCSSKAAHLLTLSVGGMTCVSCVTAITQSLSGLPGVHDVSVSLLGSSATAILDSKVMTGDVLEAINTIGYEAEVVSFQPLNLAASTVEMDGPLHVILSIAGMTCASCSSTVARLLSELEGIKDVSVNLIGNSASLIVESGTKIAEAQEAMESAGFEVSVVTVEPIKTISDTSKATWGQRTVALHIEGMFCE
jgi:P-type Cu+ transporter